jgi:hypothetical protein
MYDKQEHRIDPATGIARLGAICYVLWGLLHYNAAYGVFDFASKIPASMERGRLQQEAFYVAFFATTGIVVGIVLNWRNDRMGFWLNAITVSTGDIPFILFVLLPGYMPFWPAVLGPALWIAALICTAIGQSSKLQIIPADRSASRAAGVRL